MRLTLSVSYAVGILLQIHGLAHDAPITAARIARGCRFPPRFLYRILRRLVDAGLLKGTSGPGGGYALARSPERITLLDIVAGVEGEPTPTVLSPVCAGQRDAIAEFNRITAKSADQFSADLRHETLSDLIAREKSNSRGARRAKGR